MVVVELQRQRQGDLGVQGQPGLRRKILSSADRQTDRQTDVCINRQAWNLCIFAFYLCFTFIPGCVLCVWWCVSLILALGRQKLANLCEFQGNMVYIARS